MNFNPQEYQNTLDYLYSFVDYSLTRNLQFSADKFDLSRMAALLNFLGNPHLQYPVIHVAGTKGKGSTAAMIASVLQAAGYKTGFYISPHLEDFCERIQINRQTIPPARLVEVVNRLKPAVNQIERLTTFELTTAAGFLYFAEEKVDVAVIEVGLGGRLDATNLVTPLVSVITSISLDHTKVLGDTLEKIATEKAGIIKPGKPVVTSPQKPEALKAIAKIATDRSSPLVISDQVYRAEVLERTLVYQRLSISPNKGPFQESFEIQLPLLGDHQIENAITALCALDQVRNNGFEIPLIAVQKGLSQVSWEGRFEVLNLHPPIVVDAAHNRYSALKLIQTVNQYFPNHRLILVFGASDDKDVTGMLAELLPRAEEVIFTQSIHPRSFHADQLVELAADYSLPKMVITPLEDAVEQAVNRINSEDTLLLVTGSIFVAAGARKFLRDILKRPDVKRHPGIHMPIS
ncbi:MAG TPA: bifunctional folylpolyglutamate synthase/dihydrofolate synthase [Anaerolineaceae bacterium]|nr:bifunctional folylpolyglutamate synthase/dihydrofolate synthase [Anaerolineaceae bacterium]